MEYCVDVWNPQYSGDKLKLEKVQNRMTRMLNHGNFMTPDERNTAMKLTSHEERRRRGDLIATYKNIDNSNIFELRGETGRRGHPKTIVVPHANNIIRRHSLACRSISTWNSLPSNVVCAEDVNSFKNQLDRYLHSAHV